MNKLKNLEVLEMINCPITKIHNYRDEVFKLIPNLAVLDGTFKDGEPYESESK